MTLHTQGQLFTVFSNGSFHPHDNQLFLDGEKTPPARWETSPRSKYAVKKDKTTSQHQYAKTNLEKALTYDESTNPPGATYPPRISRPY